MTAPKLELVLTPGVTDQELELWRGSKSPTIRRLVAEVERLADQLATVTVCAHCLRRCCLYPHRSCAAHQFAGTLDLPTATLETLGREDPAWWDQ